MTKNKFQRRVKKGAELLDQRKPGWEKKITPETLDMGSCVTCILGQVYGHYGEGNDALGLPEVDDRVRLGFSLGCADSGYGSLTKAWLRLLAARITAPFRAAARRIK